MELNQRELNAMYVSLKEMCSNVDLDSIPMFRQGSKLIPRCKAGQSVQEHARSVLNNPNATPLQKKRANFARNAAKWHH